MDIDAVLAEKLATILPRLNEKQRRLVLAAEARALGHGGIARVARAASVSRPTIQKGLRELVEPDAAPERVRQVGGGRKQLRDQDPTVVRDGLGGAGGSGHAGRPDVALAVDLQEHASAGRRAQ